MQNYQAIQDLYSSATGHIPASIQPLTPAASSRKYYRVADTAGHKCICACCHSVAEAKAFIYLTRHFHGLGLPVPQLLAANDTENIYLVEDLGDTSLFDMISQNLKGGQPDSATHEAIAETLRLLPDMQWRGAENMDFTRCYPTATFDIQGVMWDLNYFKYCFLKPVLDDIDDLALENDLRALASAVMSGAEECGMETFMLRDCQSRNIMVNNGKPYFIDYQGGRRGPWLYDVVSFLWQARANFSESTRKEMLEVYLQSASRYTSVERDTVSRVVKIIIAFRMIQVLGAYGFRGLIQHKSSFISPIAPALDILQNTLAEITLPLPYLRKAISAAADIMSSSRSTANNNETLTITVGSFSYRNGIPSDPSGNGGGFVFDCRYIHNPGRYDEYKQLTGRDTPVIEFLERDGEITEFLHNAYNIIDRAVTKYIKRGFSSLQIMFGCTGGRHRSVYSAESTACHIKELFDVNVRLIHREQGIDITL